MTSKIHADYPTQPRISAPAAAEPPLDVQNKNTPNDLLTGAIVAQARHVEFSGDEPLNNLKNGLIDSGEPKPDAPDLASHAQQQVASPKFRAELRAQHAEPATSRLKPQLPPSGVLTQPMGDAALMQPQPKPFALRKLEQFRDQLVKLRKALIEQINGTSPEAALKTQSSLIAPTAAKAMSDKSLLIKMMAATLSSTDNLQTSALEWLPPAKNDKLQTQAGVLRSALVEMMDLAAQLGATDQDTSDLPAQIDQLRKLSLEFAALMVEIGPPDPALQHSPVMIEQATGLVCDTLERCTDLADTLMQWRQTGGGPQNLESMDQAAAILSDEGPEFSDSESPLPEPSTPETSKPVTTGLASTDMPQNLPDLDAPLIDTASFEETPNSANTRSDTDVSVSENFSPDDSASESDTATVSVSRDGMSSNVTGGGISVLPFATRVAIGPDEADQFRYNDIVQAINLDPMPAEYPDDESPMAEDAESDGQDSESEADSDANEDSAVGEAGDAGDADFSSESESSESEKKRRRRRSRRSAQSQGGLA